MAIVFTLRPSAIAPNFLMFTVSFLKEVVRILKLGCFCACVINDTKAKNSVKVNCFIEE